MMSISICRFLCHSSRVSYLYPIARFSPFSTSKSISETKDSFSATYLINTFGFSKEKALVASKHLKINSTQRPESFIAFLKNRGFTAEQIGSIVRNIPQIIARYDLQKVLMPKIEFFMASGISEAEVNNIILMSPCVFTRSLKNVIKPYFNYIKSLFDSTGTTLCFKKRLGAIFTCDVKYIKLNVDVLREVGVPDSRILILLQSHPKTLMVDKEKFRKVVEEVKQMNLIPSQALFIEAVRVTRSMSKVTWETKMEVYKNWGLSENDVISAFKKNPSFMAISTDKLTQVMNFFINEIGLDYSFVVKRPVAISYNLEKRIKPRCAVYQVLLANGVIKNCSCLLHMLSIKEASFLEKFVQRYEKEAPGALQVYQKAISKAQAC